MTLAAIIAAGLLAVVITTAGGRCDNPHCCHHDDRDAQ